MAVSSGSRGLEAAVVLSDSGEVSPLDLEVLRDFAGAGVVVHVGDPRRDGVELDHHLTHSPCTWTPHATPLTRE